MCMHTYCMYTCSMYTFFILYMYVYMVFNIWLCFSLKATIDKESCDVNGLNTSIYVSYGCHICMSEYTYIHIHFYGNKYVNGS